MAMRGQLKTPIASGSRPGRQFRVVLARAATARAPAVKAGAKQLSVRERALAEQAVLSALASARGRGKEGLSEEQLEQLNSAVEALEADGGVADPTTLPALDGRWRLLYTSRPGSASPIQRTFTGVDSFSIFQEVLLTQEGGGEDGQEGGPRVNNVVEFGALGFLKVEAQASTDGRPLPGFTPRQGEGLPLFGKSNNYPAARPNMRIDFQFDRAAFNFRFLPFTIPYPVPFRILGDERKGWIDVTYMNSDSTFRLSRGNKGTLFVLAKDVPIKQRLMDAIAAADDEMAESASALQKWGSKQAESFQVIDAEAGTAANIVKLGGWGEVRANAGVEAASDTRTGVDITDAALYVGPLRIPVPSPVRGSKGSTPGFIDWLYLDEDTRITRGSKGSLFIHRREPQPEL
eukprot:XP_001703438.1 plastid lipid associated protein [Chlamydomonas reinhardtii]